MVMSNNFRMMQASNNSIILSTALIYLLGLIISISELLLGLIQGLLVLVIIIVSIIIINIISLILTNNLITIKTMTGISRHRAFFQRVDVGANSQNAFVETQPIVAG